MDGWRTLMRKAEAAPRRRHPRRAGGTRVLALPHSHRMLDARAAGARRAGTYRVAGAPDTFIAEAAAVVESFGGFAWAARHTAAGCGTSGCGATHARPIEVRPPVRAQRDEGGGRSSTAAAGLTTTTSRSSTASPSPSPARTLFDLAASTGPALLSRAVSTADPPG